MIELTFHVTDILYTDEYNHVTSIENFIIEDSIDVTIRIFKEDKYNFQVIEDSIKLELDDYLESNGVYEYKVYQFTYQLIE